VSTSLPLHDRQAELRKRERDLFHGSFAKVLKNVATFWLSHSAAGLVSIPAVLGRILTLCKMAEQRSVDFAVKCESQLHTRCWEAIRSGSLGTLSDITITVDKVAFDAVLIEFNARQAAQRRETYKVPLPSSPKPARTKGSTKGQGRGRQPPRSSTPRAFSGPPEVRTLLLYAILCVPGQAA
jgi:hypothetical protein